MLLVGSEVFENNVTCFVSFFCSADLPQLMWIKNASIFCVVSSYLFPHIAKCLQTAFYCSLLNKRFHDSTNLVVFCCIKVILCFSNDTMGLWRIASSILPSQRH